MRPGTLRAKDNNWISAWGESPFPTAFIDHNRHHKGGPAGEHTQKAAPTGGSTPRSLDLEQVVQDGAGRAEKDQAQLHQAKKLDELLGISILLPVPGI